MTEAAKTAQPGPLTQHLMTTIGQLVEGNNATAQDLTCTSATEETHDARVTVTLTPRWQLDWETYKGRHSVQDGVDVGPGNGGLNYAAKVFNSMLQSKLIPSLRTSLKTEPGKWLNASSPYSIGTAPGRPCFQDTCKRCKGHGDLLCGCGNGLQTCYTCQRTGKTTCYKCGGGGREQVPYWDATIQANNWRMQTCSGCGGDGRSGICGYCSGRGEVLCTTCGGTTRVDCKPCGATGWFTHVGTISLMSVVDISIAHAKAMPSSLSSHLRAIAAGQLQRIGRLTFSAADDNGVSASASYDLVVAYARADLAIRDATWTAEAAGATKTIITMPTIVDDLIAPTLHSIRSTDAGNIKSRVAKARTTRATRVLLEAFMTGVKDPADRVVDAFEGSVTSLSMSALEADLKASFDLTGRGGLNRAWWIGTPVALAAIALFHLWGPYYGLEPGVIVAALILPPILTMLVLSATAKSRARRRVEKVIGETTTYKPKTKLRTTLATLGGYAWTFILMWFITLGATPKDLPDMDMEGRTTAIVRGINAISIGVGNGDFSIRAWQTVARDLPWPELPEWPSIVDVVKAAESLKNQLSGSCETSSADGCSENGQRAGDAGTGTGLTASATGYPQGFPPKPWKKPTPPTN